jgi:hypothetical protein
MADALQDALASAFGDAEDTVPEPEEVVETPEVVAEEPEVVEETPAAPEEGKLFAGKYKDVETLEKSYKELESKIGDGDYRALKESHDTLKSQLDQLQEQFQRPAGPSAANRAGRLAGSG